MAQSFGGETDAEALFFVILSLLPLIASFFVGEPSSMVESFFVRGWVSPYPW